MSDQVERSLRELAEAGGLCEHCGGLHVPDVDTAIPSTKTDLPWCDCVECQPCAAFRETLLKLKRGELP
jgi:hypothetical protein